MPSYLRTTTRSRISRMSQILSGIVLDLRNRLNIRLLISSFSLVIISSMYAWSWRGVIVEKSIFRDGGSSGDWSDEVVLGDLCMAVFVDA